MIRKSLHDGMQIALVKSWSTRRASHQPAFMDSCQTIGSVYLVVDDFSSCVLWPLMIGLTVVLLMFFSHHMVLLVGS